MQEQINKDLKIALLAGDKTRVETLKSLKNALQYEAVSLNLKLDDLNNDQITKVFAREAKKRQESADLYEKAGAKDRAAQELAEKTIIEIYLPEKLDESVIKSAVEEEISKFDAPSIQDMGKIIGGVRTKLGGAADGSIIAKFVKEALGDQ